MMHFSTLVFYLPTQQALPPLSTNDLIQLAVLGGGALMFVVLAVLFVVRSRKKRIRELTEALERPGLSEPGEDEHTSDDEKSVVEKPDVEKPVDEKPVDEKPVDEKPVDEKPVDEKPVDEKPVDEKPVDEKPVDEKPVDEKASGEKSEKKEPQESEDQRREQLRVGLKKTRSGFIGRLSGLFGDKRELDAELLDELEQILLTSDIGVHTADHLLEQVKQKIDKKEINQAERVKAVLKEEMRAILDLGNPPIEPRDQRPHVVMVIGVNGGGKTTTIGKLAHHLAQQGHKVLLGAGDTFRAAAADQLDIWAQRAGAQIVCGDEGQDPSSVLFDAIKKAQESDVDIVLADTAGRLHTKVNLMAELKKVHRVLGKAQPGAPHEVLLVLDATTGQNAIAQATQFNEAVPITGVVLTKLDGTAKGGVIVGICKQYGLPVRYIGIGEQVGDLRPFHAGEFVDALFADDE